MFGAWCASRSSTKAVRRTEVVAAYVIIHLEDGPVGALHLATKVPVDVFAGDVGPAAPSQHRRAARVMTIDYPWLYPFNIIQQGWIICG